MSKKPDVSVEKNGDEIKVSVDGVLVGTIRTFPREAPKFESVAGGTDLQGMRVVADLMEHLWFTQVTRRG